MTLRVVGDVHGKIPQYIDIVQHSEYSIQVGDMGFNYDALNTLDPWHHKVIGGNHDNYAVLDGIFYKQTPHFLGDFGVHTVPNFGDVFFVRGASSIDKAQRTEGLDWWPDEQLSYEKMQAALDLYEQVRPSFVITHECPSTIIAYVSGYKTWDGVEIRPSMTAQLLQVMWQVHNPKVWIFGHHHKSFQLTLEGTHFQCLAELEYADFK